MSRVLFIKKNVYNIISTIGSKTWQLTGSDLTHSIALFLKNRITFVFNSNLLFIMYVRGIFLWSNRILYVFDQIRIRDFFWLVSFYESSFRSVPFYKFPFGHKCYSRFCLTWTSIIDLKPEFSSNCYKWTRIDDRTLSRYVF